MLNHLVKNTGASEENSILHFARRDSKNVSRINVIYEQQNTQVAFRPCRDDLFSILSGLALHFDISSEHQLLPPMDISFPLVSSLSTRCAARFSVLLKGSSRDAYHLMVTSGYNLTLHCIKEPMF
jgi:hypothetical protein